MPLSAYYDAVALKGLKLAQNDIERGSLDPPRIEKIKASVNELVDDLDDQEDRSPAGTPTQDAEAAVAVETVGNAHSSDLPVVQKTALAAAWQGETPVVCVAGRNPLDEASAMMLAQLLRKHGLGARVQGVDGTSGSNILTLEAASVAIVCVSYLESSNPSHIRYIIRRVRRKIPEAKILLACWLADVGTAPTRETVKADGIATTLRDAVSFCLGVALEPAHTTPTEIEAA